MPIELIEPDWPAPPQVRALQTTRRGGLSLPPYDSLNLALHVGDDALVVARNRMRLQALFPSEPVWLDQVHGMTVVDAAAAGCQPQGDASVAARRGAVCVVMTADCLPVLLCDRAGTVVAAVHAGWRGLCGGVLEATLTRMGVAPETLLAWMGPAISQVAFEVGDEVRATFIASQPGAEAGFVPGRDGKWQADLYLLARQRLQQAGVGWIGSFLTAVTV